MSFRAQNRVVVESLESRRLLAGQIVQNFGDVAVDPNAAPSTYTLSNFFADAALSGTVVIFDTVLGNIPVQLYDSQRPITVDNFLNYVDADRYDDSIINRAREDFVLQGGGFTYSGDPETYSLDSIDTFAPINLEVSPVIQNDEWTISMARTNDPNSATSAWFFNIIDNVGLDPAPGNDGYSVFGIAVGEAGRDVIRAMKNLNVYNANSLYGLANNSEAFGFLPLRNLPTSNPPPPQEQNFLTIENVYRSKFTYTVTSTDNTIATPTIDADTGVLTVTYGANVEGVATITVQATDVNGTTLTDAFGVQVGDETQAAVQVTIQDSGTPKAVKWIDIDGTESTLTIKKSTAVVRFNGEGITQSGSSTITLAGTNVSVESISFTTSTSKTKLSLKVTGGDKRVSLGDISAAAAIGKLSLKAADLTGDVGLADVSTANFGTMSSGTFTVSNARTLGFTGAFGATLNAATLRQTSVGDVSGGTWTVLGGAGSITARSFASGWIGQFGATLSKIKTSGDFAGNVTAVALKSLEVGGNIAGGILTLTRSVADAGKAIDSIKVKGGISNFDLRANGNVGKIETRTATGSRFYAGVATTGSNVPDGAGDYFAPARIDTFTIKSSAANAFADSSIGAAVLGKLDLRRVAFDNANEVFGVGADSIKQLSLYNNADKKITLKNLADPTTLAQLFADKGIITPDDFSVVLL